MAYPANNGKPIFKEVITPIGLLVHLNHDKPLLKTDENTKRPILDADGIQEAEFRVTICWEKTRIAELQPMVALCKEVVAEAWPESQQPGAFFALEPFFRDGDDPRHNTKKRDYLFGKYYINMKQKAIPGRAADGKIVYTGHPGILGPYGNDIMPLDIWAGCTGRCSGILFGTDYMGRHFVSTRLNNIQLFETGDRIGGGGRPDPKAQFGSIKEGGTGLLNVL
jgi:hypothetical protein